MRYVWINGRLIPESKASIPVFDSAYLHGIGLFETLRAGAGKIRFLPEHFQRLRRNARTLELKVPLSDAALERELYRLLRKNRLQDSTIRMMLSESTLSTKPLLVVTARPFIPYPAVYFKKGAKLVFIRSVRSDVPSLAKIKSTSYVTRMLARREAERRGAVEGILLNEKNEVTEGASSNLFIVQSGRLITPPLSGALLPGTRRKVVLRLARKLTIPVQEKNLLPKDLLKADEIFITSTLKDILPIRSVENRNVRKTAPGPVTMRLSKAYDALI